jgi:hypothetical protein
VKRLGLDNKAIGEIVAGVDVFCGSDHIANAYPVEPDVSPAPE